MKKHFSLPDAFTVLCVVTMIALFTLQATIHFQTRSPMGFEVTRQMAYGYGTDGCDMIIAAQSFEDGLAPFDDNDWVNVSNTALYGTHSAKAATTSNNQSKELTFGISGMEAGIVSFGLRVSSEMDADYLSFYIDDVLQQRWSGEVAWTEVAFATAMGFHDYKWTYSKNASGSSGSDTAWIDMVRVGQGSCTVVASSSASSAAAPVCGNGIKTSLEECDDGDTSNGDGCADDCTIESGYECTGTTPSICATDCGDGIEAGTEECDTGGSSLTCDNDCTAVSCGDANANAAAGEECDEGSENSNTKTCTTLCKKTSCGDAIVQTPNGYGQTEACEPSLDSTCTNSCVRATGVGTTYTPPPPASSSQGLRLTPSPNCGNGILELTKNEECDQGRFNGLSPLCDRWCRSQFCGDNIVQKQNGEECEPARAEDGTFTVPQCGQVCTVPVCDTNGFCGGGCSWRFQACTASSSSSVASSASASSAQSAAASFQNVQNAIAQGIEDTTGPLSGVLPVASSSLSLQSLILPVSSSSESTASDSSAPVMSPVPSVCGDGIRNGDEECDRGMADNLLSNGCTPTCKISICGNTTLEPGEECDDGKRNSRSKPDSCSTLCLLPRCGDGIVDPAFGERCDTGTNNSGTLPDACRMNCIPAFCGDSVKDANEQCDDGPKGSKTCTSVCILTASAMTFTADTPADTIPDNAAPLLVFLLLLLIILVHKLDRSLHRR